MLDATHLFFCPKKNADLGAIGVDADAFDLQPDSLSTSCLFDPRHRDPTPYAAPIVQRTTRPLDPERQPASAAATASGGLPGGVGSRTAG